MIQYLRYCVGIDVSKDSLQACFSLIDSQQKVTIKASSKFVNKAGSFESLLKWVIKHAKLDLPIKYVMESTGVYHEQLAWFLVGKVQAVSVVLPNKAKHYLKSLGHKSKNDKIDAQGLAQMGLEQHLPLWQPLSKGIYSLRLLTRQHQRLQELKNQSQNQHHALSYSQLSDKFIVKQLLQLIQLYEKQLAQLEEAIRDLLAEDAVLEKKIKQLMAIKGLGLLSVATLVAETNGFEGFSNQRQLVSYAGYDVVENQSGNHNGRTRISKKGNSRIRRILHLPAFNAVRFGEPACQALYERVFERSNQKMKAYVAIQKKLLILAFAIWKNDTEYNPKRSTDQVDKAKKIVPTSGTTQDEEAIANFSFIETKDIEKILS